MTLHVLDQLPLWIGGDLDAAETASVERHLAQCPACRAEAERLRTSQAWLREAMTPPFDLADGERLHREVMGRLRREAVAGPTRPLARPPVLLMACAATLLLAIVLWRQDPATVAPKPVIEPGVLQPQPQPAPPQAVPLEPPRSARGWPAPHPQVPPASPARIEFQTADPNIRIIWLAQSGPLPAPPPSPEEPS